MGIGKNGIIQLLLQGRGGRFPRRAAGEKQDQYRENYDWVPNA
jgi:hypothetical protein